MVDEFASRGIVNVFEGIEERWQLEVAEEVGADMVQGYILAWPELAPTSFVFSDPPRTEPADMGKGAPEPESGTAVARKGADRHRPAFGRRTGS
jgi:EAL domain-containing protein (putative c-di-GMP-specific phosphodiesterase class I)